MSVPRTPLRVDEIDRIVAQRDDLLAALRKMESRLTQMTVGYSYPHEAQRTLLVEARAAIARAEGRS